MQIFFIIFFFLLYFFPHLFILFPPSLLPTQNLTHSPNPELTKWFDRSGSISANIYSRTELCFNKPGRSVFKITASNDIIVIIIIITWQIYVSHLEALKGVHKQPEGKMLLSVIHEMGGYEVDALHITYLRIISCKGNQNIPKCLKTMRECWFFFILTLLGKGSKILQIWVCSPYISIYLLYDTLLEKVFTLRIDWIVHPLKFFEVLLRI